MVVLTLLLVLRLLVALKAKEGSRRLINMKYLDRHHGKKSTVGWFRVYINIIHIITYYVYTSDPQ